MILENFSTSGGINDTLASCQVCQKLFILPVQIASIVLKRNKIVSRN
jgi:hypothetical protein